MIPETVETLESGHIYFFHRNFLEQDFPGGSDVERFFMILNPHSARLFRLAVLGKKNTADEEYSQKLWGFIHKVGATSEQVETELNPRKFQTKSRTERQLKWPRMTGQGLYRIFSHGDHTHLAYLLDAPEPQDQPIEAPSPEPQADFIIRVKNPLKPAPKGITIDINHMAFYPERLQIKFENRRYIDANPPELLNYEGVGLLMAVCREQVLRRLEINFQSDEEATVTAQMVEDMKLDRQLNGLEPFARSRWR
jgi:hypothetical protein